MDFLPKDIEKYCVDHSWTPSALTEELSAYTKSHVEMSVMLSEPFVASALAFLIRAIGAKRILEVGCYTGYSALCMAEALPVDGTVITLDINPATMEIAKSFWARSPHGEKIQGILGPADQSIPKLPGPFDFVFIDADKGGYTRYLEAILPKLAPGGIIAADNSLYSGEVLKESPNDARARGIQHFNDFVRSHESITSFLLPVRDGVMLIQRRR